MAVCETYRLDRAILSIPSEESDSRISTTVPSGAVVTTTDGPLGRFSTVHVVWGNKALTMFAADLLEHARLIDLLSESFSVPLGHYRNSN
jgi:hypothetical protein